MDPVTLTIGAVVLVALLLMSLAVGLWVLRKTLSLIKKLLMIGLMAGLIVLVGIGVYVGLVIGG